MTIRVVPPSGGRRAALRARPRRTSPSEAPPAIWNTPRTARGSRRLWVAIHHSQHNTEAWAEAWNLYVAMLGRMRARQALGPRSEWVQSAIPVAPRQIEDVLRGMPV
jgi:hypothetical protein